MKTTALHLHFGLTLVTLLQKYGVSFQLLPSSIPLVSIPSTLTSTLTSQLFSSFSSDDEKTNKNLQRTPVESILDGGAWLDAIAKNTVQTNNEVWSHLTSKIKVQGGTLRTCSFDDKVERVDVLLKTNGRPLDAQVELWQGHHNRPQTMNIHLEDGSERCCRVTVETPRCANSIAVRNTGQSEYPLTAGVEPDNGGPTSNGNPAKVLTTISTSKIIQGGGAVYIAPFPPDVQSIQVMLKNDGRPMSARIELLQGPNNIKQVMDIYTEDSFERTFYTVLDTPGSGNVIRIVNTATVEYPLTAYIEPYIVSGSSSSSSSSSGPFSNENAGEGFLSWDAR